MFVNFPNSMSSQFSPVPGPFHSPEGYARIGSHHAIYENHSRFQIVDEALTLILVIRQALAPIQSGLSFAIRIASSKSASAEHAPNRRTAPPCAPAEPLGIFVSTVGA